MELTDFLHAGTNSCKLKVIENFGVMHCPNGCSQSIFELLYLESGFYLHVTYTVATLGRFGISVRN